MVVVDLPIEVAALLILCIVIVAYIFLKALFEALYALVVAFADWWSSTVWPWIQNTAIPWAVDTATSIWDSVMEASARAWERAKKKVKELEKEIAKAIELKTDRVYQLLMTTAGPYPKRTWGSGWNMTGHKFPQDCNGDSTFKYGTTNSTVEGRYAGDPVIGPMLRPPKLLDCIYSPYMGRLEALALEKSLLITYFGIHFQLPPGNSKFG